MKNRSSVLAHRLRHSSLPDRQGWVTLDVLVHEEGLTLEEVCEIVQTDTKGRFVLSEDGGKVRALYGHSVPVDLELKAENPPKVLYHGTARRNLDRIRTEGICSMKRNYVHLCTTMDSAMRVGSRHGEAVVLEVRAGDLFQAGQAFYSATSSIWLTANVPPEFIV